MQNDELAFLQAMLENAELLDCLTCQDDTLHTHEEVLSVVATVTEIRTRCTTCMSHRTRLDITGSI